MTASHRILQPGEMIQPGDEWRYLRGSDSSWRETVCIGLKTLPSHTVEYGRPASASGITSTDGTFLNLNSSLLNARPAAPFPTLK